MLARSLLPTLFFSLFPLLSINAHAATLSGTVTDGATATAINGVIVDLYLNSFPFPKFVGTTTTNATGDYAFTGLTGTYTVYFSDAVHLDEHRGVTIAANVDFDVALSMSGTLRGLVRTEGGTPLANKTLRIQRIDQPADDLLAGHFNASTAADGSWQLPGLHFGTYRACLLDAADAFRNMCFDQRLVPIDGSMADYTPIALTSGQDRAGIDFALPTGGAIGGVLTNSYRNAPIGAGEVAYSIHDTVGNPLTDGKVTPDATGHYAISGLPAGAYTLTFGGISSTPYYTQRVVGGGSCNPTCSFIGATPVTITAGATAGAKVSLHPGAVLGGRVTGSEGEPLAGIEVVACSNVHLTYYVQSGSAITDADGRFEISHVRALPARLGTNNGNALRDQNWPGILREEFRYACSQPGGGFPVSTDEVRTNLNFAMERGAAASGHVSDQFGRPLAATVTIRDNQGRWLWRGPTDSTGNYTTTGLANGQYYLHAYVANAVSPCQGYVNVDCGTADGPLPELATMLTLKAPLIRTGVDFHYVVDKLFRSGFE